MLGRGEESAIVCIHKAGDAGFYRHVFQIHPPAIEAVVDGNPHIRTAMENISHHGVNIDVKEDGSFHGALADPAGDFKPFAIYFLRPDATFCIDIKVA